MIKVIREEKLVFSNGMVHDWDNITRTMSKEPNLKKSAFIKAQALIYSQGAPKEGEITVVWYYDENNIEKMDFTLGWF
jgi:hypothetical protein